MKKISGALLIVLVIAAAWLWTRYQSNTTTMIPLPYELQLSDTLSTKAPIVMVGDQMAEHLSLFNVSLSSEISTNLTEPIKIFSLGKKHHGVHRTLKQLDQLESPPALLIYHGGSEEYFEKIYDPSQKQIILNNLNLYRDPTLLSLIYLYPWMSRLLYQPVKKIQLPTLPLEIPAMEVHLDDNSLVFELYEEHLRLMVKKAAKMKSLLLFITSPLDLNVPPKKNCAVADSVEVQVALKDIRETLKAGDLKSAFSLAEKLSEAAIAHAEVFYLYGQTAKRLGQKNIALNALNKAAVFDCSFWRGHEVFNQIIRKVATETKTSLFDLAMMVEDEQWNQSDSIYFDEIFPQNMIYEKATLLLAQQVKKLLQIP